MKQYRTTIISVIVIAAAVAAFFIISSVVNKDGADAGQPTATPETEESEKMFDINDISDILRYECNIVDDIVLEYENGEWTCPSYTDLVLNSSSISISLNVVRESMAVPVYEGDITAEVYDTYDISRDKYIRITLKDGSTYTLRFGMQKPGTHSYFAVIDESRKIYLVTDTYRNNLTLTKENLLQTRIFNFNDPGKIRHVDVSRSGEPFFSLTADITGEARTWAMNYPLERAGNDTHIEEIMTAITSLYTKDYIEGDCEDLSVYGLDVPYYEITVTDNKGAQTLSLGSKVPSGDAYYCTFGSSGGELVNNVFSIETTYLTFIDDNVVKYMDTYIFSELYTVLETAEINISCGGVNETYTLGFDIWDDGEQLYFNGQAVADDNTQIRAFRKINTAIYSLDIVGIDDEPAEKGERLISVVYKLNTGETVTVEGFRRDETTMYLYKDGEYTGGYEHIRQITGSVDGYGVIGTIENYKTVSGMN